MEEVSTEASNNASHASTVNNADTAGNNGTGADFNAENCVEEENMWKEHKGNVY